MPNTQTIECDNYVPCGWYRETRKRVNSNSSYHYNRQLVRSVKVSVQKYRIDPLAKYRFGKHSQFRIVRPLAKEQESLEQRFQEQADKWRRETEHLSSPTQMMMHPSYQAILGMAQKHEQEVIRLMLHDLRDNRTPWFSALSYLTQDNPITQADAGKMDKMIKAWVEWGKHKRIF